MPATTQSWASSPHTRKVMLGNRGRDTTPELALRRRLHALGLRYKVSSRPVPGMRCTADVVFTRAKVAVFVDGCWWHGCPVHFRLPKTNADYWSAKISQNRARDDQTVSTLTGLGWEVLRFWEHDDIGFASDAVVRAVRSRASARRSPKPTA